MAKIKMHTKITSEARNKPRIWLTCHPDDFSNEVFKRKCFDQICQDICEYADYIVYYKENMNDVVEEKYRESDLKSVNLFVILLTENLANSPDSVAHSEFRYAKENNIPTLPICVASYNNRDEEKKFEDKINEQFDYAHHIKFSKVSEGKSREKYVDELKRALKRKSLDPELVEKVKQAFAVHTFLSYRKIDRDHADKLIRSIHKFPKFRDVAIWFDDFLNQGDNFEESIKDEMKKSELFHLLVTPNILKPDEDGSDNYVMSTEYPLAEELGLKILPAEMEETDTNELCEKYPNIPECINPNDKRFEAKLAEMISKYIQNLDNSSYHKFLIGVAYMEGIECEIDRKKAVELIEPAANEGNFEAAVRMLELNAAGEILPEERIKAYHRTKFNGLKQKYSEEKTFAALKDLCDFVLTGNIYDDEYNEFEPVLIEAVSYDNSFYWKLAEFYKRWAEHSKDDILKHCQHCRNRVNSLMLLKDDLVESTFTISLSLDEHSRGVVFYTEEELLRALADAYNAYWQAWYKWHKTFFNSSNRRYNVQDKHMDIFKIEEIGLTAVENYEKITKGHYAGKTDFKNLIAVCVNLANSLRGIKKECLKKCIDYLEEQQKRFGLDEEDEKIRKDIIEQLESM